MPQRSVDDGGESAVTSALLGFRDLYLLGSHVCCNRYAIYC